MARTSLLRPLSALAASRSAFAPSVTRAARFINTGPTHAAGEAGIDYRVLEGIDGFLPKENFDRITEWQGGLWERLQREVNNNPALAETKQKWDTKGLDIVDLLGVSARDKSLSLTYNYAALLANNSFFLDTLNPDAKKTPDAKFASLLEKLEGYAEGIVGGGWLWIVKTGDREEDIDIIPTFASGTLLIPGRAQSSRAAQLFQQPLHSSTSLPESSLPASDAEAAPEAPPSKAEQTRLAKKTVGAYPSPLAVVNLYELAWLGDKYGVWGKKEYVRDWFNSLDWEKVKQRHAQVYA
ncbi:hypothetical protein L198_02989 [Cryptococcus wingfieldii CBS 7118]|uniref:Manganese/iron superoxide dismutase C-terminal domain-containing protein n=1 Tax=Cryptococcus wingfieldii CBS 7118 TaxID=1295528 RepID=A0A1E3JJ56_9TREE|nr:hypothetical protein L198_02989 [Cryptococcus wingfieldii CBS 7118]ODO00666.1 hypothetical protein L198_02989 [Cryptococcus wingfieldii CBS 7118]